MLLLVLLGAFSSLNLRVSTPLFFVIFNTAVALVLFWAAADLRTTTRIRIILSLVISAFTTGAYAFACHYFMRIALA